MVSFVKIRRIRRRVQTHRIMCNNFCTKYGIETFDWLIQSFKKGRTLDYIAERLGVTKSRVLQWKNAFGSIAWQYIPTDEVKLLLEKRHVNEN